MDRTALAVVLAFALLPAGTIEFLDGCRQVHDEHVADGTFVPVTARLADDRTAEDSYGVQPVIGCRFLAAAAGTGL